MLRLPGDAETVNVPVGLTARFKLVWFVMVPDEPVTVIVNVPTAAAALVVSVNVLALSVLLGLNDALTPLGRPEIDKLTVPVNPFSGVTVIAAVPLAPWVSVRMFGEADSRKFGPKAGQLFTRLAALTVPIPVAKSHPVVVPYAGLKELLEVESTPTEPSARKQFALPVQFTSMSPRVTS